MGCRKLKLSMYNIGVCSIRGEFTGYNEYEQFTQVTFIICNFSSSLNLQGGCREKIKYSITSLFIGSFILLSLY